MFGLLLLPKYRDIYPTVHLDPLVYSQDTVHHNYRAIYPYVCPEPLVYRPDTSCIWSHLSNCPSRASSLKPRYNLKIEQFTQLFMVQIQPKNSDIYSTVLPPYCVSAICSRNQSKDLHGWITREYFHESKIFLNIGISFEMSIIFKNLP